MPPQIFKNRVIATAGPLPGQLSIENLKRWTENRRGRFSEEFDERVTHLLCTREQFRKKVHRVREALSQKERRIHIVHCDWFEESAVHNRRLPEADYSMKQREAERRAAEREERRIERGKVNGEKFVNTNYYHIYRDREFFPYQIELIKYDLETGNPAYKYTLCLWESNAKPHLHWFTAKLLDKNPGKANTPKYHRGSSHSVKWRVAFDQFTTMFKKLCRYPWENRVSMQGTNPGDYQYFPPVGGKPVGRRLQHPHEYCLEINAALRGLPWPPVKNEVSQPLVGADDDAPEVLGEERIDDEVDGLQAVITKRQEDFAWVDDLGGQPAPSGQAAEGSTGGGEKGQGQVTEDYEIEILHGHDFAKEEAMSDVDSGVDLSKEDSPLVDEE